MVSFISSFNPRSSWQAVGLSFLPALADQLVHRLFPKKVLASISETTSILAGVATYTFLIHQLPLHSSFKIAAPALYLAYKTAQYYWSAKPSAPPHRRTRVSSARSSLHKSPGAVTTSPAPMPPAVHATPPDAAAASPALKPAPMAQPPELSGKEDCPSAGAILAAASPPPNRQKVYWETKSVTLVAIPLMEFIVKNGGREEGIYRTSGNNDLREANLYYLDDLSFGVQNPTFNTDNLFRDLGIQTDIPRAASICKALFGRLEVPFLQPIMNKLQKASKKLEAFKKKEAKQQDYKKLAASEELASDLKVESSKEHEDPTKPTSDKTLYDFKELEDSKELQKKKERASKKLEEAKKSVETKFITAISKLNPDRKKLLHATLLHLRCIAGNPAHKMDSKNLASIFAPLFFNITQTSLVKATEQIQQLTAALAYLIDNALLLENKK